VPMKSRRQSSRQLVSGVLAFPRPLLAIEGVILTVPCCLNDPGIFLKSRSENVMYEFPPILMRHEPFKFLAFPDLVWVTHGARLKTICLGDQMPAHSSPL